MVWSAVTSTNNVLDFLSHTLVNFDWLVYVLSKEVFIPLSYVHFTQVPAICT